jgi:5'-3' exonuclease
MGIDGFHHWIEKEYPEAYNNINSDNKTYHHAYIDLNYLLHLCHYNSNDETHLINKMSLLILDICAKIQPAISLNLFCDGTAPFAKMVLQRERRCKNIKISDDIFKTSLNFTPGTKFIKTISQRLDKIIQIIKNHFAIDVNIDSIEAGEAEIKIKDKLLQYYSVNKNHNHILVTNDADVVLILCSDDSYKNSYILLKDNVLSMKQLLKTHFQKYNYNQNNENNIENNLDFVFLSLLLGNDYIPKVNQISPAKIWEAYNLNIEKHKYLIKLNNNHFQLNKDFLLDILTDCIAKIGRNKTIKNNIIFNKDIYDNYFNGILWTIEMYNLGKCLDYDYICNTSKPIDILNLALYISDLNMDNFLKSKSDPIPSELCGILLLPEGAKELIDDKYTDFMNDSEVKVIYNDDFKISINYLKKIVKKFKNYA